MDVSILSLVVLFLSLVSILLVLTYFHTSVLDLFQESSSSLLIEFLTLIWIE